MKRLSHSFCQNQSCIELQPILPTIFQYYTRIVDIANFLQVNLAAILDVSNGDIMTYNSYNNSGGYHVQKVDVIKINEDDAKSNFINEFKEIANSLMSNIKSK